MQLLTFILLAGMALSVVLLARGMEHFMRLNRKLWEDQQKLNKAQSTINDGIKETFEGFETFLKTIGEKLHDKQDQKNS